MTLMNADTGWTALNWRSLTEDDLEVGFQREWDVRITYPLVAWYADLCGDPNPWYGVQGSPFGPPVAPPLLMSRLAARLTDSLGRMRGFLNTRNRTVTLAPTTVGMVARFRGRIDAKYQRRGRRYVRLVIEAHDVASGAALLQEEKEFVIFPSPERDPP
ncbi:MAG: hypothetical protein V3V35_10180 [Dehalococcoidia bacterium]